MPPGPDCIKTLRQQCNDTAHNTGYTFCYKNLAITIFPCITLTGACLCLVFYCSLKIDKNCRRACPSNFSGRLTISNIKNHKKTQPNIPKANPSIFTIHFLSMILSSDTFFEARPALSSRKSHFPRPVTAYPYHKQLAEGKKHSLSKHLTTRKLV